MADRPCMHDDGYPAEPGKRKCIWHLLLKMPMEDQITAAEHRRQLKDTMQGPGALPGYPRARVPKADWPDGERWCAPCQSFVPLFYASGSHCKAHSSLAAHSGSLVAKYGITRADYNGLLILQGGRCAVCLQLPKRKRLAVDHDHETNEVRGLLCADVERGCNHAVLGSLEARSLDGVVAAAYRLIDYIENPPYRRLKEPADVLSERQGSELPHDDGGAGGAGGLATTSEADHGEARGDDRAGGVRDNGGPGEDGRGLPQRTPEVHSRPGPTWEATPDVADSDEWADFRSWLKS